MTIAEKLTKIADNEQKVYDAGYERGYHDGEIVGGGSYDQGFEDGKQAEYDAFWDAAQQNGNRTDYAFAFSADMWTTENFKPKYPINPTTANNAFAYWGFSSALRDERIDFRKACSLDTSNCANISNLFYNNQLITAVGVIDTQKNSPLQNLFSRCMNLEEVEKLILKNDGSQTFPTTFDRCDLLKNIVFEGVIGNDIDFKSCTLLTRVSIESIINHLSDTTTGKTLTLSKTAADNAFPCPIEDGNGGWINVGCGGNSEWIELVATKSNWQISLV